MAAWPPQLIRLMWCSVSASAPLTVGTVSVPRLLGVRSTSVAPVGSRCRQCSAWESAFEASKTMSKAVSDSMSAAMPPAVVG